MVDTWVACHVPYESAALVAGRGVFADAGAAVTGMFSNGDFGLSNATSLTALLTLANVSFGALDLERSDAAAWTRARQLWVPGLTFMSVAVQERLVRWIVDGGHLVMLPAVPALDEQMVESDVLASSIFGPTDRPEFVPFEPEPVGWSQVRTADGGSLAVHGEVTRMTLPAGATPIAWTEDGGVVGFRRSIGAGAATVLGFRLQYHPVGGIDQFLFVSGIVEEAGGPRAAVAEAPGMIALELTGSTGGLLCVVNTVEQRVSTRIAYTPPGTSDRAMVPERLAGLEFDGRAARLLPIGIDLGSGLRLRHATAELVDRRVHPNGDVELEFAASTSTRFELSLDGNPDAVEVVGGRIVAEADRSAQPHGDPKSIVVVVEAGGPEVIVRMKPFNDAPGRVAQGREPSVTVGGAP